MSFNRIISLVPSLTELLLDLEIGQRLVARTRFCIHPEDKVSDISIIGGTKNPNIEKILDLKPDLIIANHEENRKEDVEELKKYTKILVTQIDTIDEALKAIKQISGLVEKEEKGQQIIFEIESLLNLKADYRKVPASYFIWKDPWMVAASETYIDSVLKHYNLDNVFSDQQRYPQISLEDLQNQKPELILLSSEPFPFKQKHIEEIQEACPDTEIQLINGEWFSWYGSGMLKAFKRLNEWRFNLSNSI